MYHRLTERLTSRYIGLYKFKNNQNVNMFLVIIAVIYNITNLIHFLFDVCNIFQENFKICIIIKNVPSMQKYAKLI